MRKRREPVPRARDSWVWLGGFLTVGILGAGVVSAATLLWENVDVRQLAPALAPAPALPPQPRLPNDAVWPQGTFRAVLLNSPRNAAFFPDRTYYRSALSGWEALASGSGATVREVSTVRALEEILPDELLLLPEAPCLDNGERAAVRRHLARGGGVLANWATGVRDGNCQWVGWDFLMELTDADDVRETAQREGLYFTVPSGVALGAGMDPGTRVEVRGEPSLALRAPGTRVYWSDWALNPAPDESGGGADVAAMVSRHPAGGRVAWIGPRLDQGATVPDSLRLSRVARNGIHWAAGLPLAYPAAWPGGHRAALVAAVEVESEAENAGPVATLLRGRGVPGSFYAVTGLVEDDQELAAELLAAGEVGSQTADHTPLAGLTAQDQAVRLRRSRADVERWTGTPAVGLRPPEETLDSYTLRGWVRAGGLYLLALNNARSASPEIHETADGPAIVIPRLMKDDYNVFVQDGAIRAPRLAEAWLEGTEKLRSLGGVAAMVGHTQILEGPTRLGAVGEVLDTLRAQGDWWMATGSDVASWWLRRDGVRLTWVEPDTIRPGQGVYPTGLPDLLVEVPAEGEGIEGLWVDLVLPGGSGDLVPWVDGQPSDFATAAEGIQVPVGELGPGTVRRIRLLRLGGEAAGGGS